MKLLAGFTRKKASTHRVNRKIADSTRNQRVFFSRYLAANYGSFCRGVLLPFPSPSPLPPFGWPHRLGLPIVVCVECLPADKPWDVVSATRRSSGVAPRVCVRVYARVLVPPNLYIHIHTGVGKRAGSCILFYFLSQIRDVLSPFDASLAPALAFVYICVCIYIYIYIYRERERVRVGGAWFTCVVNPRGSSRRGSRSTGYCWWI